jgi:diguanylate cyclase (GGDEF)-like protein
VQVRKQRVETGSPAGGWLAAGLTGIVCSVTLCVTTPDAGVTTALISIACGAIVTTIFAPWRRTLAIHAERRDLAQLATAVRRCIDEQRPLSAATLAERDDTIGDLTRLLEELLTDVRTTRRTSERLQRNMGESIRRETRRQTIRVKKEALTDPLTGLANRRALHHQVAVTRDRFEDNDPIVAMAVDMDHFKQVNDTLGHETGDGCLRFLGDLLQSSVRRDDCPIRFGGDEFIVLMPGQTLAGATTMSERLCSLFRQMPWPYDAVPRPTLSIGLASMLMRNLDDGSELLRQADAALYGAKRGGRAQVATYEMVSRRSA